MTSLLTAPLPDYLDDEPRRTGRPELRLVPAPGNGRGGRSPVGDRFERPVPQPAPPRRRDQSEFRSARAAWLVVEVVREGCGEK